MHNFGTALTIVQHNTMLLKPSPRTREQSCCVERHDGRLNATLEPRDWRAATIEHAHKILNRMLNLRLLLESTTNI